MKNNKTGCAPAQKSSEAPVQKNEKPTKQNCQGATDMNKCADLADKLNKQARWNTLHSSDSVTEGDRTIMYTQT